VSESILSEYSMIRCWRQAILKERRIFNFYSLVSLFLSTPVLKWIITVEHTWSRMNLLKVHTIKYQTETKIIHNKMLSIEV
jgi:hypothetical protein